MHVPPYKSEDWFFREQKYGLEVSSHAALANADGSPRNSKRVTKEGEINKDTKKTQKGEGKRSGKSSLSILENNCFGLKAKWKILLQAIKAMRAIKAIKAFKFPSFVTIQERKLRKMGSIKINEYQVFEDY